MRVDNPDHLPTETISISCNTAITEDNSPYPTEQGKRNYPPYGYYDHWTYHQDYPCTCVDGCAGYCKGHEPCNCAACSASYSDYGYEEY